jgi:adenosylcobinamide kinase/adenosylcobinamide-phosphate guanylyltransferase
MAKLVFVTGGVRSGKSYYAEQLAKAFNQVTYIATGWAGDEEMTERIRLHQERRPASWDTIEEQWIWSVCYLRCPVNVSSLIVWGCG